MATGMYPTGAYPTGIYPTGSQAGVAPTPYPTNIQPYNANLAPSSRGGMASLAMVLVAGLAAVCHPFTHATMLKYGLTFVRPSCEPEMAVGFCTCVSALEGFA